MAAKMLLQLLYLRLLHVQGCADTACGTAAAAAWRLALHATACCSGNLCPQPPGSLLGLLVGGCGRSPSRILVETKHLRALQCYIMLHCHWHLGCGGKPLLCPLAALSLQPSKSLLTSFVAGLGGAAGAGNIQLHLPLSQN
jgi:hypothetical protein